MITLGGATSAVINYVQLPHTERCWGYCLWRSCLCRTWNDGSIGNSTIPMYPLNCTAYHVCTNSTETAHLPLVASIILTLLMVLIIAVSIFGNLVVCVIVYRKAAMRSAINLLLANMALSNIVLACVCMSFAVATLHLDFTIGVAACKTVIYAHHLLICASVLTLLTISVDRYLIIVCRKDKLTPQRASILIIGVWCLAATFALPPTVGWGYYYVALPHDQCMATKSTLLDNVLYLFMFSIVVYFLPMLIMAYSFLSIINTVRKNSLRVQCLPVNDVIMQCNYKPSLVSIISLPHTRVNVDMSFKTRAFKTIFMLFITFLVCWAPYSVHSLIYNFIQSDPNVGIVLLWIAYTNCALNPIIYFWRIKKFREACRQIPPKLFKLLPNVPEKTRRRIKPSTMYEISSDPVDSGDNQTSKV